MATSPPRRTAAGTTAARRPRVREMAAQATQENILRAATKVFAKNGFAGGRIEEISKAAKSHDRMIYYYFGNKEELFIAVIEDTYRRFNEAESKLVLKMDNPVEDLKTLVRFMWTYYQQNPEFITLLNSENLHRGKHISKSMRAREYSSPAISLMDSVLKRGAEMRLFRADVRARDIYLMSAALAYFYTSNRFTLSAFLGEDLAAPEALAYWEDFITSAVIRQVSITSDAAEARPATDERQRPAA
ncbi:MAG TPA: TetR/AcrR family transcriptional regulator [Noviherbaspirillum sp.]|jgi:AcrR family transcriptional regulator|uniref:TetR/AcrR family transcriptional regulator n=1 Tax=Noviherbaspirillum sp. TaxID=1926288 RepID=UPI002DDD5E5E|nr:TetR/AcrR family transcriptional regulator [Noviherbaspirillum sp.]HEV2609200.1 TetR/AcrR family transcriptional regulator [Noviherbaspirillum sp.]